MTQRVGDKERLSAIVDEVARTIVATEHVGGSSFIRTPLLYPSGSTAVVRIEEVQGRFFVSDMGMGYQEAEMMGAAHIFARHARPIAEAAGVRFDNQAFFVLEATKEQLPGAVVTIANCSQEAAALAAYKLAERKVADAADRLYEKLVTVFEPKIVARDAEVVGSSSTAWHVATLVTVNKQRTIFEPVARQPASVAFAAMKFHDIARLERPPNRVAVVQSKSELNTYLGVLAQAASVVETDVPNETLRQLARAA